MMRVVLLLILATTRAAPLLAQHDHGAAADSSASPYAALADRDIKALGADEIAALRAGEGMGMALAAELNGYPGPKHVLELAHELGLNHATVERIQTIRDSMLAEATAAGAALIAAERELDRAFATGTITDEGLRAATARIAALRGALRYAHLRAHLAVTALLEPAQIARYQELRGYRAP